jgi:gluconolactonase
MFAPPQEIDAQPFARLPEALHYRGEPNIWVRTTRPGMRLHSFLEGPCFDKQGDLWLVDVPYGRIFRIKPDGAWSLALAYDGEPHALALLDDGRFAVADYRRGLLAVDPESGEREVLCDRINSEAFRGLGDMTRAPNGDLWFTDPGRSSLSDPTGRLFRLRPGADQADLVLDCIPYPNGVALSPDGKLVYLSVTRANAVWRLMADAPDPVYPMVGTYIQLSGGLGPDGLSIDARGRLAVAHGQAGRAFLFDAIGDPICRIRTPGGMWTTAVAFAPDGRSLFIVEAQTGQVYRADLSAFG